MNKDVKKLWLKALRSEQYVQGTGQLVTISKDKKRNDRFCCLGVLCQLAIEKDIINDYNPEHDFPPAKVALWAGLERKIEETLAGLNDDEGFTFKQIARYIEKAL